jgi:predicted DNA-binding antitoxin AbrB/MazE fold protein
MTQTLEAVYEDGVFKPLSIPHGVPEHAQVTLSVEVAPPARSLQDVIGTMSREDAEEMQDIVRREFGRINPDDWK